MFLGFDPTKNTYHTIAENLKYITTEFQDILPVKLKKRCFRFKDKNELEKPLMENKGVFHNNRVAISRHWYGNERFSKKNMKLDKARLKRLKI